MAWNRLKSHLDAGIDAVFPWLVISQDFIERCTVDEPATSASSTVQSKFPTMSFKAASQGLCCLRWRRPPVSASHQNANEPSWELSPLRLQMTYLIVEHPGPLACCTLILMI